MWAGGLLVALVCDVGLLLWLRRRRRRPPWAARPPEVLILGVPSPTLTWLRYRVWPWLQARFLAEAHHPMTPALDPIPAPAEAPPASPAGEDVQPAPPVEPAPAPAPDVAPSAVRVTLEVPPGVSVRVTVETAADGTPVVHQTVVPPGAPGLTRFAPPQAEPPLGLWGETWAARLPWLTRGLAALRAGLGRVSRWEWALFAGALLIYAFTRLYALDQFPIYFFSDEANIAMLGERVFENGLRDAQGHWLPIYFEGAGLRWTPVLSIYFHGLAIELFGRSIFTARATSALLSLFGVAAVALTLKLVFKSRWWWAGIFLLAVSPAWLIHTRTAFETVTMASFYACFLLCYLLYRERSPRFLFPALVFGAATFYTYSNAQLVMGATALFLFLSDLRYHLKNWRTLAAGALLAVVLAAPFLAFQSRQPEALSTHLRAVDSYMFRDLPAAEKARLYLTKYAYGLSPQYWFFSNETDLQRHRMPGAGQMPTAALPFFLAGVALCLWKARSSPHRAVLLAALAAPAGAALLDIGIARVMTFLMPATILAVLGLEWLLSLAPRLPERLTTGAVYAGLAAATVLMFRSVLADAPLWFRDYGLYGMQYGAKQLFQEAIPQLLRQDPAATVMVSSTWANGADAFIPFFIPPEDVDRVLMRNVEYYMFERRPLDLNTVLVMTPGEYAQAQASGKFKRLDVERLVPYPDGSPGFYFARLEYADNVDALFAAEQAARRQPVVDEVLIDNRLATVTHSRFDSGRMVDLLDGDRFTLARGLEANPLRFDFAFPEPRAVAGLAVTLGSMDNFSVTVRAYAPGSDQPAIYTDTFVNQPNDPTVRLPFLNGPASVERLELEVKNNLAGDVAQIHVREIVFEQ